MYFKVYISTIKRNMRFVTVEPVIFSVIFTFALLLPLLQQYIYEELSAEHNFTKVDEEKLCENVTTAGHDVTSLESQVQTEASHWFLVLNLCTCIPSVFSSLFLGSLSDVVGRKPVMLIAVIGIFLRCLIIAITVTLGLPFYVVFLGSLIDGLTGSFPTILGSCFAYIIDITDKESRSFRLGVLEIAISFGATASVFTSGVWLKMSGYEQPFWAGVGIIFICGLYIVFFLSESLVGEKQKISRVSCMVQIKRIKDFVLAKRGPYVNTCLKLLFIAYLFAVFDYFGNVTILYAKHYPLCWGPELIGYYLAAKLGTAGLGIVFGIKVLGKIFPDSILIVISCSSFIVSNVVIGFATTTVMMFLSCIPSVLSMVAPPCVRSIASQMVKQKEEGTLCSIIAITEALAQVLSPLLLNFLYPIGITKLHLSGFIFFIQAGVLIIPVIFFLIIYYLTSKNYHILNGEEDEDSLVQT